MIIYVAHANETFADYHHAEKVTHALQVKDTENCYVCPALAFAHIGKDLSDKDKTALKLDLLTVCDSVLIASRFCDDIKPEIEFANSIGMEIHINE